jgi:RNA polymerase sigma-70 factor (ECF subfamily)
MLHASARESWEVLADRLGGFIARRLPPDDVDDVLQDVLLRIHKSARDLTDEQHFGAWVYSIARNAIVDRLRRKRASTVALDEEVEPESPPEEPDPSPLLSCVTPFVARLPSPYREAITLVELHGLTQQQAAELAGVSLSGMKSRVQRGRRLMRGMLEECCQLKIDARGRVFDAERRDSGGCDQPCGDEGQNERPR